MSNMPFKAFEAIAQRIHSGAVLTRAEPLQGGVSAQVILLEIRLPEGDQREYLLRIHGEIDRMRDPEIATHEYELLKRLHEAGLPVSRPVLLGKPGDPAPAPYIVVTFIRGKTEFSPPDLSRVLRVSAAMLAEIHAVGSRIPGLDFLPERREQVMGWIHHQPDEPDEALLESRLREKLRSIFPIERANEPTLLHGDFWPGNLIWENGELAGVIDWEDAEIGDPLSDLSIARLEILWAFGRQAMDEFTRSYRALKPELDYSSLPHWDLFSALRPAGQLEEWAESWGPNGRADVTYDTLRQAQNWFAEQALRGGDRRSHPDS